MAHSNTTRIHGLDVLRGVAMTLGIFLHGAIAYKKGYHYGNWVFDDQFQSYFFDWFYLWTNSFRMQVFFLLAGFFARLLIHKVGLRTFSDNRFRRIVIPFVLCYFTILPLTLLPYLYVEFSSAGDPWKPLVTFFESFFTLRKQSGFMHLWFLQHLIVFYVLLIMVLIVSRRLPEVGAGLSRMLSRIRINSLTLIVMTSILLGGISLLFDTALPSIWTGFIIPVPQLLYYLFFFMLGWQLETRRELFTSFNDRYKIYLVCGSALSGVTLYWVNQYGDQQSASLIIALLKFLFAFQTMFLTIGFIGLFNKVFRNPSDFWRYVADAAYWVYLIHMPVVMTLQLLLVGTPVPGVLRFPIVIMGTIIVSFASYHYLVRFTWVGYLLNGKRLTPTKLNLIKEQR